MLLHEGYSRLLSPSIEINFYLSRKHSRLKCWVEGWWCKLLTSLLHLPAEELRVAEKPSGLKKDGITGLKIWELLSALIDISRKLSRVCDHSWKMDEYRHVGQEKMEGAQNALSAFLRSTDVTGWRESTPCSQQKSEDSARPCSATYSSYDSTESLQLCGLSIKWK